MNTIFNDIIVTICDFLDDYSKLSFLSVTKKYHRLKNKTKFDGPINADSNIWYINSFDHFSSSSKYFRRLDNCRHLTLIDTRQIRSAPCYRRGKYHNAAGYEVTKISFFETSNNLEHITYRLILKFENDIDNTNIYYNIDNKYFMYCVKNKIKIDFEIIFQPKIKNMNLPTNIHDIRIGIGGFGIYDYDNETINYLNKLKPIIIKSGSLEINKKYFFG